MDEKKNKSKKKAAKQKQPPRYKALMYTQQINHLKLGNVDNLIDRIEKSFNYTDYAVILHDKDTKKDSTDLAEEHVHVMFHFKNARTVQSVAKKLNDDDQYVKI